MSQGTYDWEGESIALRSQLKNTDKAYESNRRLAEDLVQEKIATQKRIQELESQVEKERGIADGYKSALDFAGRRIQELETERDAVREALVDISKFCTPAGEMARAVLERFKK